MTMDLERLDEAIEQHYRINNYTAGVIVRDAARAFRDLLANGERVMWCDEHKASADEDTCWSGAVFSGSTPCRIVPKLLVDYPTEGD